MNYFKANFGMIQHHKYSLTEIEDMMPWERQIYTRMLLDFLEMEEQKAKEAAAAAKQAARQHKMKRKH